MMVGVPQLSRDEEVLALDHLALKQLLEGRANFLLVLVDGGAVNVAESSLDGRDDGAANNALLGLPSAKA